MKDLRLYIHIPFCKQRCSYCDFPTYDDKSYLIHSYFNALQTEIALYSPIIDKSNITSVFFGGGTPSYPEAEYIGRTLGKCNINDGTEVTIEANPGTVDYDKLLAYHDAGINRISFGVQSFNNDMLLIMGRIHDRSLAIRNIKDAQKAGFENISIDLMHGYPMQSESGFSESLETAIGLGVRHISCYSLKIEDGTPLRSMVDKGILPEPDDDADRRMYETAKKLLGANGFMHYEISNFAMPGYECRHNIGYWKLDEYIGLGAAAHSYYNGRRFSNTENLGGYIRSLNEYVIPENYSEEINEEESIKEFMILGLRMTEGVNTQDFYQRYGRDIFSVYGPEINECTEAGLLKAENKQLRLTSRGLDFANKVFRKFI
ncbi:MAG: radical SAM family heme chaperone HemW [Clostridia bacterium]|nr:radical SAM family heme chaperone HemW [Clostridia bacterium]